MHVASSDSTFQTLRKIILDIIISKHEWKTGTKWNGRTSSSYSYSGPYEHWHDSTKPGSNFGGSNFESGSGKYSYTYSKSSSHSRTRETPREPPPRPPPREPPRPPPREPPPRPPPQDPPPRPSQDYSQSRRSERERRPPTQSAVDDYLVRLKTFFPSKTGHACTYSKLTIQSIPWPILNSNTTVSVDMIEVATKAFFDAVRRDLGVAYMKTLVKEGRLLFHPDSLRARRVMVNMKHSGDALVVEQLATKVFQVMMSMR
ncbi:hypothetical protein CYLTODRAFT_457603 [Cylindrobasidium torrendii FP15055 ss-10]|uniref:Uncharacterized protein n=1 Tax=Cylindrobasidium torrendii FP15055 ss-10 TaxID=1314674 RepID=A0A0D7B3B6_9AGAR|nr:hypothetical protein CYLTODRAFT_457603 [Cylindrobasidium torrendii FP15055 ss-10]